MTRKVLLRLPAAALCLLLAATAAAEDFAAPRRDGRAYRIDFSDPARFLREWQFNGALPMVPHTAFYLATVSSAEDGRVLVIEADRSSGIMMSAPPVDLERLPIMHWRWRVVRQLNLADRERREPDDQVGVVYIGDGNRVRQYCVAYRWEHNTPLGAGGFKRYKGGLLLAKCFCLRNRDTRPGEWVEEYRNVAVDFRAAFGRALDRRFILCVGGNSQYTQSNTRIEIDYIEFLPRTALPER